MKIRSTTYLTLAALTLGFSLGWWARGPDTEYVSTPPADEYAHANSTANATPRIDQPVEIPSAQSAHKTPNARPVDGKPNRISANFRAYLETGAYRDAMELYRDADRIDSSARARLKAMALEFLDAYQRQGDRDALIGLIDALLSVHYDDIDVLLFLARHQHDADYFQEAAHTFQLAFTYALTQMAYMPQIERAFDAFVSGVDTQLSSQYRWRELSYFYEHLGTLGLSTSHHQLRLAELYLEDGQRALAHELLERLSAVPTVAAQAAKLRERRGDAEAERTSITAAPLDVLTLNTVGRHFYLPVRLNRSTEAQLLIDTGASMTTLSQDAFRRLRPQTRFTEVGPQIFNTAGGTTKGTVYRIEQFRLGDQNLTNVHIAVLDFALPPGVDGLLGMNVLSHFHFQVDQEQALLHIQPR